MKNKNERETFFLGSGEDDALLFLRELQPALMSVPLHLVLSSALLKEQLFQVCFLNRINNVNNLRRKPTRISTISQCSNT